MFLRSHQLQDTILNNLKRLLLAVPLAFVSCTSMDDALLEQVMLQAESNAPEIEKVLGAYVGEKKDVAEYLVRGMLGQFSLTGPGLDSIEMLYRELPQPNGSWKLDSLQRVIGKRYERLPRKRTADLQALTSDYITRNIDDAWKMREFRHWNKDLSLEEFCELLLPYRIGNEPVTEWRNAYRNALDSISGKIDAAANSVEAAAVISQSLGEIHYTRWLKIPDRPAPALLESPVGYCREECSRNLYAMRAFGIPAAIDEYLVSPANGTPHQWNVVYDNIDRRFRMFENAEYPPTRDSLHNDHRRKGKVYRRTLSINMERLEKLREIPDAPQELTYPRLKDVTWEYFGHNKAEVKVDAKEETVYLGIFTPEGYRPIDIAEKSRKGNVVFRNIEPDLIYFPIVRKGAGYSVCGNPFMLLQNGKVHEFIPDMSRIEKATLTRKMGLVRSSFIRMSSVVGCKIQVGQTENGPWIDVDSIERMPEHNFYRIPIGNISKEFKSRYIRVITSPFHNSQIGEVIVSEDSLAIHRLPLSSVTDNHTDDMNKLVDGDILTWTIYRSFGKTLVFRVDSDKKVDSIFYVPRNDDNYVVPGEEYELFYFACAGWKSLGRKVSEGFSIDFEVPANAVLWLRNLTKGREEQIFICRDGRQLFNTDLRDDIR